MIEIDISKIPRQSVRVEVFDAISDVEDGADARAYVAALQDCLDGVPEPYRYQVRLDVQEGWDGAHDTIKAFYERPETDSEWRARVNREVQWARGQRDSDFQTFLRLKALFEPAGVAV